VDVTISGVDGGFYLKLIDLEPDLSEFRLYFTPATRARAYPQDLEDYLVANFEAIRPSDYSPYILGLVDDATFMGPTPTRPANAGNQSTGIRSIRFIRKIQMKIVSASGPTRGFLPLKEPRTLSSMNSTTHSTKFCQPPGTPAVAVLAALRNPHRNRAPRPTENSMLSTLMAQKPISAASAPL